MTCWFSLYFKRNNHTSSFSLHFSFSDLLSLWPQPIFKDLVNIIGQRTFGFWFPVQRITREEVRPNFCSSTRYLSYLIKILTSSITIKTSFLYSFLPSMWQGSYSCYTLSEGQFSATQHNHKFNSALKTKLQNKTTKNNSNFTISKKFNTLPTISSSNQQVTNH